MPGPSCLIVASEPHIRVTQAVVPLTPRAGYEVMAPYTSQPYAVQSPQPAQHPYAPHMNGGAAPYHQPGAPLMQASPSRSGPLYCRRTPVNDRRVVHVGGAGAAHGQCAAVKQGLPGAITCPAVWQLQR